MAGMMREHRRRRAISNINVVPYIDVMLVLLVIFMVTAPLVNPGVVELPSVGTETKAVILPIEVTILQDETLQVRNRADNEMPVTMSREQLSAYLQKQQAQHPEQAVVIAADKNIRYDAVMQLMDILQQQQIKRVGLLVQPASM